jgi:formylglycine-generating enzyme
MMKRAVSILALLSVGIATMATRFESPALADSGAARAEIPLGRETASEPTLASVGAGMVGSGMVGVVGVTPLSVLPGSAVKQSVSPVSGDGAQSCPENSVEVVGDYCPLLEQKCMRWLDPEMKLRCAEFETTSRCLAKTQKKHFCIDRFEYPNKVGEKPLVLKSWHEAAASCKSEGKRLCRDSEWTLACEGQERLPYPYGYARNAEACNIDKPHPEVDERALANPATRLAEAARLDQRSPSGAHEACVSPYGVFDMAGNVDEWVVNESNYPYQSGSKGGYWGPVRTRCRPMTTAHYELFSFYQLGFRCCADATTAPSPLEPSLLPRPAQPISGNSAPQAPSRGAAFSGI